MKKRVTAALLCCALLAGCGGMGSVGSEPQPEPSVRIGDIAYVPLDDRPDNAERVEYLANSLGYRLAMPEEDWYQTKLDSQPLNGNGTQSGDRAKLYEWVLEQEAAGCDRYILFLDQLLSGGLVNSRHISGENPVTLSDGTVLTEAELLEQLLETLSADGNNRVWLLDTVMRLAPTCGYDGFGIDEYNRLREYGMQPRPALAGGELTVENILADYRLSAGGTALAAADYKLTDGLVEEYLSARERKLRLSDETQQLLQAPAYGNFRLLVGIDDSSAEDSIQKNEIAYLRQNLRTDGEERLDWLLSGVDDLAFKAVARMYLDEMPASLAELGASSIHLVFVGGTEDRPACAYDSQPLGEIVKEHLEFFGLTETPAPEDADLQLVVLTQPEVPEQAGDYCNALIAQLKESMAQGIPTILMDAANNAYGTAAHDALAKEISLGMLLGYAGFLDMAIVTGTALSHGVARYAWLCNNANADDLAHYSFRESLGEAIILDFCYRNTVRDDISAWVRQQGGDPNNFYAPAIDTEAARQQLEAGMAKSTKAVLKNFSNSNFITDLAAYRSGDGGLSGWGRMTLENWSFPWQRVFEVRMDILPGPVTEPHRSIFDRIFAVFSSK